jgi:hypothetical protein
MRIPNGSIHQRNSIETIAEIKEKNETEFVLCLRDFVQNQEYYAAKNNLPFLIRIKTAENVM